MEKNIKKAIKWLKKQEVKGCITGSCLLGYFEDQDIDIFLYDEKSFTKLLFEMHHNKMFTILDPIEKWKFEQYINNNQDNYYKFGLITIKFHYNTCIPINIIIKKKCTDIFSVISTFDMDIISRGYDIETKQYLDLCPSKNDSNIVSWNKWNTSYYSPELWKISRILRQLERCFKYHKRGFNVDLVVKKYISLIDYIQEYENHFTSVNFEEQLKIKKSNTKIVKKICKIWLKTHEITDSQLETIKLKIKEI